MVTTDGDQPEQTQGSDSGDDLRAVVARLRQMAVAVRRKQFEVSVLAHHTSLTEFLPMDLPGSPRTWGDIHRYLGTWLAQLELICDRVEAHPPLPRRDHRLPWWRRL